RRGLGERQMQADLDCRRRECQRHCKLQIEKRISHGGHDVGPDTELGEEHQKRDGRCSEQRQRQHEADRPGPRVIGGKSANELIGLHSHCSLSLAVRLARARCNATRTAPSLIEYFAAVSLIDALSTAIDCRTARWRAGKDSSWVATSLAETVSAAASPGSVSAKSSMLTNTRLP